MMVPILLLIDSDSRTTVQPIQNFIKETENDSKDSSITHYGFTEASLTSSKIVMPSQNSILAFYDGVDKAISIIFGVGVVKNQNGDVVSTSNLGLQYYDATKALVQNRPGPAELGFTSRINVSPVGLIGQCTDAATTLTSCAGISLYDGTKINVGVKYPVCCFGAAGTSAGSISNSIKLSYNVTVGFGPQNSIYPDGTAKPWISSAKTFTLNLNVYNSAVTTSAVTASAIKAFYTVGVTSTVAGTTPVYSIEVCGTAVGYTLGGLANTRLSFLGGDSILAIPVNGNGITINPAATSNCQTFQIQSLALQQCDATDKSVLSNPSKNCNICQITSFGFQGRWTKDSQEIIDTLSHTISITDVGGNSNTQCWTQVNLVEQVFAVTFDQAQVAPAGQTTFGIIGTNNFAVPGSIIQFPLNVVSSASIGVDLLPHSFKYYASSVSIGYKPVAINPAVGTFGVTIYNRKNTGLTGANTAFSHPTDDGTNGPGLLLQIQLCAAGPGGKPVTKDASNNPIGCFDWSSVQQSTSNSIVTFTIPITTTLSFSEINNASKKRRANSTAIQSSSIASNFTILFNQNPRNKDTTTTASSIITSSASPSSYNVFFALFASLFVLMHI
ncbi:UNVERIFIED_CONTAM: hypothetical protein HDU68_006953 [Siphonaria sp. JEL0065]|nr:hypothetical protein HDU68_006953 [Siphonaria sp. JEL0065]